MRVRRFDGTIDGPSDSQLAHDIALRAFNGAGLDSTKDEYNHVLASRGKSCSKSRRDSSKITKHSHLRSSTPRRYVKRSV